MRFRMAGAGSCGSDVALLLLGCAKIIILVLFLCGLLDPPDETVAPLLLMLLLPVPFAFRSSDFASCDDDDDAVEDDGTDEVRPFGGWWLWFMVV